MSHQLPFNSLLVPIDFSEGSRQAFDWAMRCIDGSESVIFVLHVIDDALVETIADHGFASHDEVVKRMREQAEDQLALYKMLASDQVQVETIIAEGAPFLETIRKADDFVVDAIVMGRVGRRGQLERLLFGSTAEKVLRGALRPVIVLPQLERS